MKVVAVAIAAAGLIGHVRAEGWESWAGNSTTAATSSSTSSTKSSTKVDGATTYTTVTGTLTITKTIYPQVSSTSTSTKSSSTSTKSTTSSSTSTKSTTSSSTTSMVKPTWSENGWFGDEWATAASGQCVMNVVTSYGDPIWKPTPAVSSSSSSSSHTTNSTTIKSTTSSTKSTTSSTKSTTSSTKSTTSSVKSSTTSMTESSWTETWAEWASTSPVASSSASSAKSSSTASSAKVSSTASSSSAKASSTGTAGISANGNSWAMTYTPYTSNNGCKDSATIAADIAKMAAKGFSSVRVYSTDCSTLEYVGAAVRANNMKMILGVFISTTGTAGAQSQVSDIVKWAQWDIVELIVVGNEAIFNGYCSAADLAAFISSSKSAFSGAGYSGSVTTTEDLATWQSVGSQLCSVVDVVSANLYAFFNPNTQASDAGTFIQSEIAVLSAICGNKETYVMESGWPSAGSCNGVACPGVSEQATAIKAIQGAVGSKIVFFSFENELWKSSGEFGVEQHWGCADVF